MGKQIKKCFNMNVFVKNWPAAFKLSQVLY